MRVSRIFHGSEAKKIFAYVFVWRAEKQVSDCFLRCVFLLMTWIFKHFSRQNFEEQKKFLINFYSLFHFMPSDRIEICFYAPLCVIKIDKFFIVFLSVLVRSAPSESEREEDIGGGVACAKQIHSSHPMMKDGKRRLDNAENVELSLSLASRLCLWGNFHIKFFIHRETLRM
jgi:hypothetical protein